MFDRKNKNQPKEQGSAGRRVERSGGASPAFSYYTNRVPDTAVRQRMVDRPTATGGEHGKWNMSRVFVQLPFWLLMAVLVICAGKVLLLSTNPKMVVLNKNSVTASYVRSTATYETAAQKLLSSSITSRTKVSVNLGGVAAAMEHEFPEFQTVTVTIGLISNRPIVYAQLAQPSLVLQTTHGNFALNKSGLVLARLQSLPSSVPLVVDQSNTTPIPGKQFLASSTVSFVQTVAYQFQAAKLDISAYILPANAPYELDVRLTDQPYVVRYNLQGDPLLQSGGAVATIQQLGATVPASYIDVRTPGRVYYK